MWSSISVLSVRSVFPVVWLDIADQRASMTALTHDALGEQRQAAEHRGVQKASPRPSVSDSPNRLHLGQGFRAIALALGAMAQAADMARSCVLRSVLLVSENEIYPLTNAGAIIDEKFRPSVKFSGSTQSRLRGVSFLIQTRRAAVHGANDDTRSTLTIKCLAMR